MENINKEIACIDNTNDDKSASIYTGMNEVFIEIRKIFNNMQDGEKIAVKDLQYKVAANITGISSSNVKHLVQLYCKQAKDITVEVGRSGGIFKGGKKKRHTIKTRCKTCNQFIKNMPSEIITENNSISSSINS